MFDEPYLSNMVVVPSQPKKQATQPGRAAGGKARAAALSPERRSEIAKQAAMKRWSNSTSA